MYPWGTTSSYRISPETAYELVKVAAITDGDAFEVMGEDLKKQVCAIADTNRPKSAKK